MKIHSLATSITRHRTCYPPKKGFRQHTLFADNFSPRVRKDEASILPTFETRLLGARVTRPKCPCQHSTSRGFSGRLTQRQVAQESKLADPKSSCYGHK
ncbi:hypothetical protein JTE90_007888 [Oedothorax gibbosus]|uniref:Uncharacterized protein n=1 Tax=Oedothorax gibbosus TaxID=931172 RepID=A0AAV6VKD4_9ARAC|nr:hypothetical protein JTE90_007888 [Oedothorax gibbosus]